MTAKRVRRQHLVSRFYLRGFADGSAQTRRVTLPGGSSVPMSISDASVIKDFYTVTLPDGTKSDMFERWFADFEGPASAALAHVRDGTWPLPTDEREALAAWIALQHLRSKSVRDGLSSQDALMFRLVIGASGKVALRELIEGAEERVLSQAELDWEWGDITKPGGPDLRPDSHQHLALLMDLVGGTVRLLSDCHWTLYRFRRRGLLTSDHPVSLLADEDHPAWHGIGLATADAFLVPLSRHAGLMIQHRERMPALVARQADWSHAGTTKAWKAMNQETAWRAQRYLYHHPDDDPIDGLCLPEPDRKQWRDSGADGLIREEGLFHGMSQEELKTLSGIGGPHDRENSITIRDLPWPLPDRATPDRPAF